MTEIEGLVPVKVMVRVSTYRQFRAVADERGIDVGVLLSRLADRAVGPARKPGPRKRQKPRVSLTPEQVAEAAQLRTLKLSYREIAAKFDCTHTTVRSALARREEASA